MQKFSQILMIAGLGVAVGVAVGRLLMSAPQQPTPPDEADGCRPSPVPDPAAVARHFAKVPDQARQEISRRIAACERYGDIPYTPTTIALLNAIISRINRKTNRAEIDYSDLARACGVKSRTTLARHIKLLEEALGYIAVRRAASSGNRKAINVYSLRGVVADVVLDIRAKSTGLDSPLIDQQPKMSVQSVDCLPDESKTTEIDAPALECDLPLDDPKLDDEPIPESCTQLGIDPAVTRDLMNSHGRERVDSIAAWAAGETWADNPAALAVARIKRQGWTIPKPKAKKQWMSDGDETAGGEDYQSTEWDYNPRKVAPSAVQPRIETMIGEYPAWQAWQIAGEQIKLWGIDLVDCRMVGVDGNTVILETAMPHVQRLYRDIAGLLRTICGVAVSVQFSDMEVVA